MAAPGRKIKALLFALPLTLVFANCGDDQKTNQKPLPNPKPEAKVDVPKFSADSAYAFIQAQVDFGPRVPGTPEHKACGDYLVRKFSTWTDTVVEQYSTVTRFDGQSLPMRNIIASINPSKSNRIALFAHWDTRFTSDKEPSGDRKPIDGANDGGSGVAVLMEMARVLSKNKPDLGIDFILFDVEDQGKPADLDLQETGTSWCLGSQYWSKNLHQKNYYAKFGVLLDMVGGENAVFTQEGVSRTRAPQVLKKVWQTGHKLGYGSFFSYEATPEILDDHVFVNYFAHIPTIDIIAYDHGTESKFYQHWHTLKDDMEGISKAPLKAVGQTLLHVIYTD